MRTIYIARAFAACLISALVAAPCRANTFSEKDYKEADNLRTELSQLQSTASDQMSGAAEGSNAHLSQNLQVINDGESEILSELSHLQDLLTLAANMVDATDENDVVVYASGEAQGLMRSINTNRKFLERIGGRSKNPLVAGDLQKFEDLMDRAAVFATSVELKTKQHPLAAAYTKP